MNDDDILTAPIPDPDAEPTAAERAHASNALLGTQPVHRHSPPIRCFSISATRAPRPAAPAAVTRPAAPPPIAIMS